MRSSEPEATTMAATSPNPLLDAYELLSSYVSHGAFGDDGQFDDLFDELAGLVPHDTVRPLDTAYRVLVVPAEDLDTLLAGGTLPLRPRRFGSWTRSEDAARRVVRSRFLRMDDDQAVVVVAKPVTRESVVVDVQQVYRRLGFDVGEVEEWGLYASWEAEVILRQDGPLLAIGAGDVRLSFRTGDLDAVRPQEGEMAWSEELQDVVEIVDVHEEQPFKADGLWHVGLEDGGEMAVTWNGRQAAWDVDGPIPAPAPAP